MRGSSRGRVVRRAWSGRKALRASGLVVAILGAAGAAQAQAVTTVRWASRDTASGRLTGAPDLSATVVAPGVAAVATGFRCATGYANLAALLGVRTDVLARADVIAFELNGGSPGENGGWESAEWLFRDGPRSFHLVWDAVANEADPPEGLLANGSLSAASYRSFFGITGSTHDEVISFQLIDLPDELNVESPLLRVRVQGYASGEGTPDPDAIGLVSRRCGCAG